MGMFDEIRWEAVLPEGHPPGSRVFQTKSLDPCMEYYLVTANGRLLLVGSRWEDDTDLETAQNLTGVDVEFHGDLRMVARKSHHEYLVRFTHGTVEWVKSLADGEPYDVVALARLKLAQRRAGESGDQRSRPELADDSTTIR